MALGEATMEVVAGGGQQRVSGAQRAKTVAQLGVALAGAPATIYQPGDLAAIVAQLGVGGTLAEAAAMRQRTGLPTICVPINPSVEGAIGDVTQTGTGAGTITPTAAPHVPIEVEIVDGGTLGTMTIRYRLAGGEWSALITSSSGATWVYRVPSTFTKITFASGTYQATATLAIAIDGTVAPTPAGVGDPISSATAASSPIDYYDVRATVLKSGGLGTAVLRVSLDGNIDYLPDLAVPSGGVLVIPNTGLVLTCASTFVAGNVYQFYAAPPSFASGDLTAAINALRADQTIAVTLIHVIDLPASAAAAMSRVTAVETAMQSAFNTYGLDWQAMVECPSVGDIVISGGKAIADTADTDAAIKTARLALSACNRTALCAGTHRQSSTIGAFQPRRPFGWALAGRYVDTEPRQSLSAVADGSLTIVSIARDEAPAGGILDDVQINTARTYRNLPGGVFLSITSGGFGWKNLTTAAAWQDAEAVRLLNTVLPSLRAAGLQLLGQRPPVNADGTVAEKPARAWDLFLARAIQRAAGMVPGGDFVQAQASLATARVLRSSQLGAAPRRLDIEYTLQPLGFVSAVAGKVLFSGVLTITQ